MTRHDEKVKYPRAVFFVIGNEFCERFCFYGLRALLFLYLKNELLYSGNQATSFLHLFLMLAYFFPLIGAILADSFLGKFKTILYLSLIYSIGCVVLSVGSIDNYGIPARWLSLLGLLLIAIGTGGIKPCVSAFGGDQFQLPDQEKQLAMFFSLFYFAINLGSTISTYVTPILKANISCFGAHSCYPLAFGVPSLLMLVATVIFVVGRPFYKMKRPDRNIILEVILCITHALKRKFSTISSDKKEHWLDYSVDRFDQQMIKDTKEMLNVLYMFLPLPVFWALFEQQTSRWIAQAESMDGQIGVLTIIPEQMGVVNPLLILVLIPLFDYAVYPLLDKFGLLTRPLQRLAVGGLIAAAAFVVSALLEFKIEDTYAVIPQNGEAQLRFFNGINCSIKFQTEFTGQQVLPSLGEMSYLSVRLRDEEIKPLTASAVDCYGTNLQYTGEVKATELKSQSYLAMKDGSELKFIKLPDYDQVHKAVDQSPVLRVIYALKNESNIYFKNGKTKKNQVLAPNSNEVYITELHQLNYQISLNDDILIEDFKIFRGGVYTLVLSENDGKMGAEVFEVTPGNTVHILWQLIQITLITMAEIMFSITGLKFGFTEAPVSMKSLVAALWLMTTAVGNVLVAVIAEIHIFDKVSHELLLFAVLMVIDIFVFSIMSIRYKYKTSEFNS